jgi:hexosaminidase
MNFYFLLLLFVFGGNHTYDKVNRTSLPTKKQIQTRENDIPGIIPQPVSIQMNDGALLLKGLPRIVSEFQFKYDPSINYTRTLTELFGKEAQIDARAPIHIYKVDTFSHQNTYLLHINDRGIRIYANSEEAVFYAFQSLCQLLPIPDLTMSKSNIALPFADIYDYPHFKYRGMHLDVSRHFFDVDAVKQYIDMLAFQKMNYFHWHLTDDQGWRIEIKKYPELTRVGSCRSQTLIGHAGENPERYDNTPYCHYYTQEEIKEVVAYAQKRYITIVPEIEMPGHATAAIASYPFLGCADKPVKTTENWGVFYDIFCPTDTTFHFLENVLSEVMDLFPSKYIHIGGDEVPKREWENSAFCQQLMKKLKLKNEMELQSYFIQRIEKFVNSKGRTIIGWDEILEGGLAPNAVVMSWRGTKGGLTAANAGHDVIMTPGTHCYFDHYQAKDSTQPLAIGGYTPISKVYDFNPIPDGIEPGKVHFILGGQANLWAEYIGSVSHLQYMAYPRSFALAEALWTPAKEHNYANFLKRLDYQLHWLDYWNINYAHYYKDDMK